MPSYTGNFLNTLQARAAAIQSGQPVAPVAERPGIGGLFDKVTNKLSADLVLGAKMQALRANVPFLNPKATSSMYGAAAAARDRAIAGAGKGTY